MDSSLDATFYRTALLLGLIPGEVHALADTLTIVRQMRSMLHLPTDIYEGLNAALVAHAAETGERRAIAQRLERFTQPEQRPLGPSS